jgi:hypothetical protein
LRHSFILRSCDEGERYVHANGSERRQSTEDEVQNGRAALIFREAIDAPRFVARPGSRSDTLFLCVKSSGLYVVPQHEKGEDYEYLLLQPDQPASDDLFSQFEAVNAPDGSFGLRNAGSRSVFIPFTAKPWRAKGVLGALAPSKPIRPEHLTPEHLTRSSPYWQADMAPHRRRRHCGATSSSGSQLLIVNGRKRISLSPLR